MQEFIGAKVALIHGGSLVTIQRDDKPGLRFRNMWEMSGGGREGDETPEECVVREVREELGLEISSDAFIWKRQWPAMLDPSKKAWFFVAKLTCEQVSQIKLGDEGKCWKMMSIEEFMAHEDVVPHYKPRLQDYLDHGKQR